MKDVATVPVLNKLNSVTALNNKSDFTRKIVILTKLLEWLAAKHAIKSGERSGKNIHTNAAADYGINVNIVVHQLDSDLCYLGDPGSR